MMMMMMMCTRSCKQLIIVLVSKVCQSTVQLAVWQQSYTCVDCYQRYFRSTQLYL